MNRLFSKIVILPVFHISSSVSMPPRTFVAAASSMPSPTPAAPVQPVSPARPGPAPWVPYFRTTRTAPLGIPLGLQIPGLIPVPGLEPTIQRATGLREQSRRRMEEAWEERMRVIGRIFSPTQRY